MKMKILLLLITCAVSCIGSTADLAKNFASPPASARPWVFWFWINGNISKEGITKDLEAMNRVGIGGVLWMEVSGPWWAPEGKVTALSPEWHECMQWAVKECQRLGMQFDLSVDFGYGSGGPHITPDLSMQKLYWSQTECEGGRSVALALPRPTIEKSITAWLRPGARVSDKVAAAIEKIDSYRDVAVIAIPAPLSAGARDYKLPELPYKSGINPETPAAKSKSAVPADAVIAASLVMDLTNRMTPDGRLEWNAPAGKWLVLRFGHASNFKMTRPSPAAAVGLECDRLAKAGIDAHYNAFLKPIFEGTGTAAGTALSHVHVDSWEAGGQNWTAKFPDEFRARRGYDLRPWLPVLTGRMVGTEELTDRFLWDVRLTVSEMTLDNYVRRLRQLAQPHGIRFSTEAYGRLCIDNLAYAGASDLPIGEFWAKGDGYFPTPGGFENSTKVMSSAAHTYGKPVIGAESFTSGRGWRDHPFLLKAMGDKKFTEGLNQMIFHLSAHQAYDKMVPGLTHRKWGLHFQRFNTWWDYSTAWLEYLARCQYLLQQGRFVADVCYWYGEGAPINVEDMHLEIPAGYDFDYCSSETVLGMSVKDGRIVLPSGMSYRYLKLPATDRMTLPLARKVLELVENGARVIGGKPITGSPSLSGYPRVDAEVREMGEAFGNSRNFISGKTLSEVFAADSLPPDFEGNGLRYIHRRVGDVEVYFVSSQENRPVTATCTFRVNGKAPELWDPETGEMRPLPAYSVTRTAVPQSAGLIETTQDREAHGTVTVSLRFEPMQSWFVVFRENASPPAAELAVEANFTPLEDGGPVEGPWKVILDPKWGGPISPMKWESLQDLSTNPDPAIRHYSGRIVYETRFKAAGPALDAKRVFLNLGAVGVMAEVSLNGQRCGIAWKPPYKVEITKSLKAGENQLEISVANLWVNRLVGDETLPLDSKWKDAETLLEWPAWFVNDSPRPSGRYTFTSARHYTKDSPLPPSGLLGPVQLQFLK